jgi:transcriptional regulator with GAF, ATPase, and Fis domain
MKEAADLGPEFLEEMRGVLMGEQNPPPKSRSKAKSKAEIWHGIIGTSPAMLKLRELVLKFAPSDVPVILRGESGTGKDLVARAIHEESPRRKERMVSENCAAIPETLLESTLFGHKRGSFTGAVRDHPGHFVTADRGTLFLDEVGDMPLTMQSKLLRVLQEGEVRPVGGSRVQKVDVRVLAATNQDLEKLVAEGNFRKDLFYRLNVLQVELPPLRQRGDDIVLLAGRFLSAASGSAGRQMCLGDAAGEVIAAYSWPGNVRQLQNEMQRVAALCDNSIVQPEDLSDEIRG